MTNLKNEVRSLLIETSRLMKVLGVNHRQNVQANSTSLSIRLDSPRPGVAYFAPECAIPDETNTFVQSWKCPALRLHTEHNAMLSDSHRPSKDKTLIRSLIVHEITHYLQEMSIEQWESSISRNPERIDDPNHTADYFNQKIEVEAIGIQAAFFYSTEAPESLPSALDKL